MPSPESNATGFNSEILFQALIVHTFRISGEYASRQGRRGWFESNKVKAGFQCYALHRAVSTLRKVTETSE